LKVEREKLRLSREAGGVVPASDLEGLVQFVAGKLLFILGSLPPRISGQDLAVRRRAEAVVREVQQQLADACGSEAARLLKDGKAA
jgi:hypothetical protein